MVWKNEPLVGLKCGGMELYGGGFQKDTHRLIKKIDLHDIKDQRALEHDFGLALLRTECLQLSQQEAMEISNAVVAELTYIWRSIGG